MAPRRTLARVSEAGRGAFGTCGPVRLSLIQVAPIGFCCAYPGDGSIVDCAAPFRGEGSFRINDGLRNGFQLHYSLGSLLPTKTGHLHLIFLSPAHIALPPLTLALDLQGGLALSRRTRMTLTRHQCKSSRAETIVGLISFCTNKKFSAFKAQSTAVTEAVFQ